MLIASAHVDGQFRGVIDNTQATLEAAGGAAMAWLQEAGDQACTAVVSDGDALVAIYGWDGRAKAFAKIA